MRIDAFSKSDRSAALRSNVIIEVPSAASPIKYDIDKTCRHACRRPGFSIKNPEPPCAKRYPGITGSFIFIFRITCRRRRSQRLRFATTRSIEYLVRGPVIIFRACCSRVVFLTCGLCRRRARRSFAGCPSSKLTQALNDNVHTYSYFPTLTLQSDPKSTVILLSLKYPLPGPWMPVLRLGLRRGFCPAACCVSRSCCWRRA